MGRLKKKNKQSLSCDQDIGTSAIAIFAIHTCLFAYSIFIYGLNHQYPIFFSAECLEMRGKERDLAHLFTILC